MSWLYASLSEDIMPQIVGYSTTVEIWNALNQIYYASSMARVIKLHIKLQTLRKDGLSASEYIQKLKSICNSLAAIGELFFNPPKFSYPAMAHSAATHNTVSDTNWYMDSSTTHHFTPDITILDTVTPFNGLDQVTLGNGHSSVLFFITIHTTKNLSSSLSNFISSSSSLSIHLFIHLPLISPSPPTSSSSTCSPLVAPTSLPSFSHSMSSSVPPSSLLPPSVDLPVPCVDKDLLASSHTHNIHPMVTRSKASIYKPKLLLSVFTNLSMSLLPFSKLLKILHGSRPWNWNLFPLSTTRPSILFLHFPQARLGGSSHPIGIHLSQAKYIIDLLTRATMLDVKPCPTPMSSNTNFSLHDGVALENGSNYRSFVDALQYYTMIRPDIAFAINKPSFDFNITCYTDADWASCSNDRCSTSDYYLFLAPIWFLGHLPNKKWYLGPSPNHSTEATRRTMVVGDMKFLSDLSNLMAMDKFIGLCYQFNLDMCRRLTFSHFDPLDLKNQVKNLSTELAKVTGEELTLTMGLHAEGQSRVKLDVLTSIEERFPSSRAKVPTVDATPPILPSDKPSSSSRGGVLEIDISISSKESKSPLKSLKGRVVSFGRSNWQAPAKEILETLYGLFQLIKCYDEHFVASFSLSIALRVRSHSDSRWDKHFRLPLILLVRLTSSTYTHVMSWDARIRYGTPPILNQSRVYPDPLGAEMAHSNSRPLFTRSFINIKRPNFKPLDQALTLVHFMVFLNSLYEIDNEIYNNLPLKRWTRIANTGAKCCIFWLATLLFTKRHLEMATPHALIPNLLVDQSEVRSVVAFAIPEENMVECSSGAKIFLDLFQVSPMDSTKKRLYATTSISPSSVAPLGQYVEGDERETLYNMIAAINCIHGHPRMALYGEVEVSTKINVYVRIVLSITSKVSCPATWVILSLKPTKIVNNGSNFRKPFEVRVIFKLKQKLLRQNGELDAWDFCCSIIVGCPFMASTFLFNSSIPFLGLVHLRDFSLEIRQVELPLHVGVTVSFVNELFHCAQATFC
ncbi:Retrovirus-related Pol polyprotein from transposon RE2 [Vitis vinifera]|uniref:Retrovirus-related Pol polyprotein from transposon RE2 n=1 Tax=Vitis vinifera TaxID=29760 RepID=A0A438E775_VITVI|nr:Retrovirus-related Pol polyprotein from transposon RE2 [Vitis vinifera]